MRGKNIPVLAAACAACLALMTCGDKGGSEQDTSTSDTLPPDSTDTTTDTTPPDTTNPDVPDDTTVPDTTEDTAGDTVEDTILDLPGDGSTACELDGGYCTTYAIVSASCVTCAPISGVTFEPAAGPDGTHECTAEGEGVGAWCCMPVDMTDAPACVLGGGGCYPHGGGDRCPIGWVEDTTMACNGSNVCCVPGEGCSP